MTVEAINVRYDQWMVKSGKLTEENLTKHGFLRAPHGTKELDGELLRYIERRF